MQCQPWLFYLAGSAWVAPVRLIELHRQSATPALLAHVTLHRLAMTFHSPHTRPPRSPDGVVLLSSLDLVVRGVLAERPHALGAGGVTGDDGAGGLDVVPVRAACVWVTHPCACEEPGVGRRAVL